MYKNKQIPKVLLLQFLMLVSFSVYTNSQVLNNNYSEFNNYLPAEADKKPTKKRKVLIFNPLGMLYHSESIKCASKVIELIGDKTGAFSAIISSDPAIFNTKDLKSFDAIVLNNTMGNIYGDENKVQTRKQAIINFVANGKGLVGIHSTTVFDSGKTKIDSTYGALFGASLIQHPWNYDEFTPVMLSIENPTNKLMKAFDGKSSWLMPFRDEVFQFYAPGLRENAQILLSVDLTVTPDKGSDLNKDYPLAWIKKVGKGRVFYFGLGHSCDTFYSSEMLSFLLSGIQFTTNDINIELTPIAKKNTDLEAGFESIFNGENLDGWRGDKNIWSVKDDIITGETLTKETINRNNYLIWNGGELKNFELKVQFKLVKGNSGIYFHSYEQKVDSVKFESLVGVQADFAENDDFWVGTIMEYTLRDVLASRGRKAVITAEGKRVDAGEVAKPKELLKNYKKLDWNEYHIIVRDNLIVLRINDVLMSEVRDYDKKRLLSGLLALQVHVGNPMQVQFKNIRLKKF